MSIWSRSHNDLARLAKALKDRNAQTRQGLMERGRTSTWQNPKLSNRVENCAPSSSQNSPLANTVEHGPTSSSQNLIVPDHASSTEKPSLISCDNQVHLADPYSLNFVQRGRTDSFSSADSAISPDFHGCSPSPLSPILKRYTPRTRCSSDVPTRNTTQSPKGPEKKVTFSQDSEEALCRVSQQVVSVVKIDENHNVPYEPIDTAAPTSHSHEITNSQTLITYGFGEEADLCEIKGASSLYVFEKEGNSPIREHATKNENGFESPKSFELPSATCKIANLTSSAPLEDQSTEFENKTIGNASLTSETVLPPTKVLCPSVTVQSPVEETSSSSSASSLNLSSELNTLLISVLADHKRLNLQHKELTPPDKPEDCNKCSGTNELLNTTGNLSHSCVNENIQVPSFTPNGAEPEDVIGTPLSESSPSSTLITCQNGNGCVESDEKEFNCVKSSKAKDHISWSSDEMHEREITSCHNDFDKHDSIDTSNQVVWENDSLDTHGMMLRGSKNMSVSPAGSVLSTAHFGRGLDASHRKEPGTVPTRLTTFVNTPSSPQEQTVDASVTGSPSFVSPKLSNSKKLDDFSMSANVARIGEKAPRFEEEKIGDSITIHLAETFPVFSDWSRQELTRKFWRTFSCPNLILTPRCQLPSNPATSSLWNSTTFPRKTSRFTHHKQLDLSLDRSSTSITNMEKLSASTQGTMNSSYMKYPSRHQSQLSYDHMNLYESDSSLLSKHGRSNHKERSFNFPGLNEHGSKILLHSPRSPNSYDPILLWDSNTSGSSIHSNSFSSVEEHGSIELSTANTTYMNDIDCAEEYDPARMEDNRREWSKYLHLPPKLASVPNIDVFDNSCDNTKAHIELITSKTGNECREEDTQLHKSHSFQDDVRFPDSHCFSVVPQNNPNFKSANDGQGVHSPGGSLKDYKMQKESHFDKEERKYQIDELQDIPEKLPRSISPLELIAQNHEREGISSATSNGSLKAMETFDACNQNGNLIDKRNTSLEYPKNFQHSATPNSPLFTAEEHEDSLLDPSLAFPIKISKTKSSYNQMSRVGNFSKFLLAQFPDSCNYEQNFENCFDFKNSGDVSRTFQHETRALKFQKNTSSGAHSAVLLNILKAIQLLNGFKSRPNSHTGNGDKSKHASRRNSINSSEMKQILRQLKDSQDFLSCHPAHELQTVRDDLQKLSLALRQQLSRSKTNLESELQHRNAAFQGQNSKNLFCRPSEMVYDSSCAIHRNRGSQNNEVSKGPHIQRHRKSFVDSEAEIESRAVRTRSNCKSDDNDLSCVVPQNLNSESSVNVNPRTVGGHCKEGTEMLNELGVTRNNSDRLTMNSSISGSLRFESKPETVHLGKHTSLNPFKEMHKFMCEELNMSMTEDDKSQTDHIDEHNTAHEVTSMCPEDTYTSAFGDASGHNLHTSHPQQHTLNQNQPKNRLHLNDTNRDQCLSNSQTLQALNHTFCFQKIQSQERSPIEDSHLQNHLLTSVTNPSPPSAAAGSGDQRADIPSPPVLCDTPLQHRNLPQPRPCPAENQQRLRPYLPLSMESDSELTFQLDRDFDKHLADMKPHVLKLPQKTERQKSAVWIKKLCEPAGSSITARQNRNMYAKLMLHMLRKGSLHSPFDQKPREGPLQPLPSYMSIYFDDPLTDMSPQAERLPDWVEGELGESVGSSGVPRSLGNPAATSTWVSSRERPHSSMGHTLEKDPSLSPIRNTDLGRSRGYSADDMSLEVLPSPAKSALKQQKRLHQFPPLPNKEKRHLPDVKHPKPSEEHHVKDLNDTDWSKPFGTSMISNFSLPKGSSLHDDFGHSKPSDREVAVRTKMIEAKFHEEKLKLQQRHDAAVQKIIDRKNTEIEDMKAHYKSKSKEMDDTINKLERKVQTLVKETDYIRQTKDKQINELKTMSDESNETRRSEFEKKLHDVMTEFEQEKFDLQKQHTQNIQEILDDTNGRLQRMEAEYSQQTTSTTNVIKELESRVQQLMTEVDSTLSQRSAVEKEKNDALVKYEKLSAEHERLKDRLCQVEKEHAIALESHEHELRTLKNKTEASLEFLKQEHSMAASKASDTISELEDKVDQLKKSLKDTEEHRHRQIRELEQGHQQDKVHLENLHDKQIRNMKKEIEQLDSDWSKKLAKAEQQTKDREQEISKLKEQKQQQAMQAEQALEEFKGQVEKNQTRISDDMKQQMQKVEFDLQKSKQAREKQAKEFARQLEEEKYRHQHEIAEIKMAGEAEKSQMLRELHVQKEYMITEQERETESLKDIHKTEILALEARLREKTDKAEKAQSDSERLIRELREELVQANQLRKQQLVELGLLREEEKQKMTRDHEAELSRIRGDSEQQRLELQKSHSAEMETVMEKTNDRLKNIEKEYAERGHKSAESMAELQAIVTQLRGDIKRSRENSDEKLAELKQQYEEEKKSLRKQYSQNLGTIQRELESQRNKARDAEVLLQQQESDQEDKITQLQLQFEQKMRGLLPADLKQELEDTIASLRSQVSSLQQRSLLLQEELDGSMSKHNGSILSYSGPPITSAV